ncbi:MAG: flagellar biosynthetic protein FliR [Lysobacteraceae bacterium]|nr:MAG: flagellar biosynthetic protein FliR [Xanthomonadaceae bacterium]
MDATTAVLLDGVWLLDYLGRVVWTSLRVGGLFMVAPLIGTRSVPARVRLAFVLALSAVLAPIAQPPPLLALDGRSVLTLLTEIGLGVALGFILRVAFEAAALAGELVAQGMALAFAQLSDPLRGGATSGVVGMWFYIGFALLFLAFDGHVAMIELLLRSYQTLPVGAPIEDPVALAAASPQFLGQALLTGVSIALPLMMAMMVVNLAFGVLGRAAPALNPIAVGLPAALASGMLLMALLIQEIRGPARQIFDAAFAIALDLAR